MLYVNITTLSLFLFFLFFFNDTATTEIYTLSLHDALPIWLVGGDLSLDHENVFELIIAGRGHCRALVDLIWIEQVKHRKRSEEHTSELQSQSNLVCRLLLEKKKKQIKTKNILKIK